MLGIAKSFHSEKTDTEQGICDRSERISQWQKRISLSEFEVVEKDFNWALKKFVDAE